MNQGTKIPATNKAQDNLEKVVGTEEAEFAQLNLLKDTHRALTSLVLVRLEWQSERPCW